jgi:uncharacterized protein
MYPNIFVPTKEQARKIYGKIKNYRIRHNIPQESIKYNFLNMPNELKLSPFVKIFEKNGKIALFHRYTTKKVYGGKELKEFLKDLKKKRIRSVFIAKKLLNLGFLVKSSFSEKRYVENFREKVIPKEPDIRLMYFILTDICNFGCRYCFIEKGALKGSPKYGNMTYDVAKAGVDFFIRQIRSEGEKTFIFYGGEPLLNFDVLKETTLYIREKEKWNSFKGPVRISLITNGSLVTKEIAEFVAEQKIGASISLDGPKEINDKMRIYQNGRPTFNHILRGYKLFKRAGVRPGISCTINWHNMRELDEIVGYFGKKLGVTGIGFNLPHLIKDQENYKKLKVPIKLITKNILKAYEKCRELGITEDRVFNRRILPFGEEFFWSTDCAGCGNQIVVLPDGSVGPCHAFLGTKKYFSSSVFSQENLVNNPVWIEWKRRAPLFMNQCSKCAAISICGGGCGYQAYNNEGSIWELDKDICPFCDEILEWMIWDLDKKI